MYNVINFLITTITTVWVIRRIGSQQAAYCPSTRKAQDSDGESVLTATTCNSIDSVEAGDHAEFSSNLAEKVWLPILHMIQVVVVVVIKNFIKFIYI